jgi:hypothetical protein
MLVGSWIQCVDTNDLEHVVQFDIVRVCVDLSSLACITTTLVRRLLHNTTYLCKNWLTVIREREVQVKIGLSRCLANAQVCGKKGAKPP